ncbi:unnamed protein product, partial [Prorocentrum cordatum]
MARAAGRAALAAALALGALPDAAAKKEKRPVGIRLAHHSFERTLTYADTLGDWLRHEGGLRSLPEAAPRAARPGAPWRCRLSSAATMALRDRVQLMPAVADRQALFWSKRDIATQDFEVRFTLSGRVDEEKK